MRRIQFAQATKLRPDSTELSSRTTDKTFTSFSLPEGELAVMLFGRSAGDLNMRQQGNMGRHCFLVLHLQHQLIEPWKLAVRISDLQCQEPDHDSDPARVKSELATFFAVFPHGTLSTNLVKGEGFDLVLLGRLDDQPVNVDALQQRLDRPEYSKVAASLSDVGFHSAVDFLATYAGRAQDLSPFLSDAEVNTDLNMLVQYLAGLGLNSMSYQRVYKNMLAYRKFPEDLFQGAGGRMDALRTLLH